MADQMENPTFAELKERFKKMNVLPYPRPITPTSDNESAPATNPPVSERGKVVEPSNKSSANAQSTASNSTTASSETSNATAAGIEAKLAQVLQQNIIGTPNSKKPPVPLPRPPVQPRKQSISQQVPPSSLPDVNVVPPPNQSSVLPAIVVQPDENIYDDVSDVSINPSVSSDTSGHEASYESFDRSSTTLPTPLPFDQRRNSHSESLSMSLDTMLPLKCMFFEYEKTINKYQRRDPRTIIYPKMKPVIPKITSNEINTLQRYSNA